MEARNYIAAGSREALEHIKRHVDLINDLGLPSYIAKELPHNWVILCAGEKTNAFQIDEAYLSPKPTTCNKSIVVQKEI